MNFDTARSVVEDIYLPDGTLWSLPILLPTDRTLSAALCIGSSIALRLGGTTLGTLELEEKLHSLADWAWTKIWGYIRSDGLPFNPLHEQNYLSIGCTHCTRPVKAGEDLRAPRWSGFRKTECGLHAGE